MLNLDEMLSDTEHDYHPRPGPLDGTFGMRRGTTVVLRDFLRKRVASGDELSRQLAARFGLERSDRQVVAQTRDFGIPAGFTGEFELRSYLVGAIHVEWLDDERELLDSTLRAHCGFLDRVDDRWLGEAGRSAPPGATAG
ncbi:hypothetical protein [Nocardia sp. NPDC003963]